MANIFLLLATILCVCGMAWLALAMDTHWRQVRSGVPAAHTVRILRLMGATALFTSLLFCLQVDHATMASLVWVMLLGISALSVAVILSWQPRLLVPLIAWSRES
jgi:UDP-N-acetylmuramyl pentapeptide phosphotransferase/UDP-N-acetylglucosamine-1-phosphate transferase